MNKRTGFYILIFTLAILAGEIYASEDPCNEKAAEIADFIANTGDIKAAAEKLSITYYFEICNEIEGAGTALGKEAEVGEDTSPPNVFIF